MISRADVEAMIDFFDALGYDPPESAGQDPDRYVSAFAAVLFDLDSVQMMAACVEYARRGRNSWPKPRDLLEILRVDEDAHADVVWGMLRQHPWSWPPQRQALTSRTWCLGSDPDDDLRLHRELDTALAWLDASAEAPVYPSMTAWWSAVRAAPLAASRAAHCLSSRAVEVVGHAARLHGDGDPPATRGAWWLDPDADEHARRVEAIDAVGGWRAFIGVAPGTPTSTAMQATFRRVYAAGARRAQLLTAAPHGVKALEDARSREAAHTPQLTARDACDMHRAGMARTRGGRRG